MLKDPSVLFVNLYMAYFYGTYYTFFEVFPIVFGPFYGFNLGEISTVFLANFTGAIIGLIMYFSYIHWYLIPDTIKNDLREQEHRLIPSIFGSFFLPVGMFMFAWTVNAEIFWIVPLIGCCILNRRLPNCSRIVHVHPIVIPKIRSFPFHQQRFC